ncbi:MAG: elongation factor G, partial [bacterium JZ-2024 1]
TSDGSSAWEERAIPEEYLGIFRRQREHVEEVLAEQSDEIAELYLEGKPVPAELLKKAIRKGVLSYTLVPAFCGSAYKNKGVDFLLDAVVDYLPSPVDMPPIQGWHAKTQERVMLEHSPEGHLAAYAFKVATDPFVGRLVYVRVYSGCLRKGQLVLNATRGVRERLGRVLRMHSNYREDVEELTAGELGAIVGVKNTFTGDTLCEEEYPVILEALFVPEAVVSVAIEPRSQQDQDKLARALKKLAEEDPTFRVHFQEETGQTIVSGMGELHLEIITSRLQREFQVDARVGKPEVAYKETITRPVEVEGRYVRQSGGRGQFGVVYIRLEPIPPAEGFQFESRIREGRIPAEFIPAIQEGIKEALPSAGIYGFPVTGIKVILLDGQYHEVDSSDIAFKMAGAIALRNGVRKAAPILLEPMMKLEVAIPEGFLGAVLGDLQSHRGQVSGLKIFEDGLQLVQAIVPLEEMFGYSGRLRTLTQGKGTFTMEFYRYEPKPTNNLVEGKEQVLIKK